MGIALRDGRTFDASDRPTPRARRRAPTRCPERTVVINEALAKKYFPGENPIGRRLGGGFRG